jgi:hypothetical protein
LNLLVFVELADISGTNRGSSSVLVSGLSCFEKGLSIWLPDEQDVHDLKGIGNL